MQTDGRIAVAGSIGNGTNSSSFALARFNSNGSLDTSFGSAGLVTTGFGDPMAIGRSVVVQPDGGIVAAGYTIHGAQLQFALARYQSNGSLDTSFGSGGKVITSFGVLGDEADGVVVQPDGRTVAAGYTLLNGNRSQFALARYTSNGSLDTSFGGTGKVTTSFGLQDRASSVALQSDGRIVAVGSTYIAGNINNFALARYNNNGSLDTSFGSAGLVTTGFGDPSPGASASCGAVQADGRILAAGGAAIGGSYSLGLARYDPGSATLLTSSASPSVYGQPVTFTATVTAGGSPVTAGTVTFAEGSNVLGTGNVDGAGHATYTTATLTAAGSPHNLTATYTGTPGIDRSSGSFRQTVSPANLTVSADDQSRVYGEPNPTLTASYSGFVLDQGPADLGGTLNLTTTATIASGVGSYPITAGGNLNSPNYTIDYTPGTLTVTPAPLTITADDKSKVAGDPVPPLTASYSGFVNGDTPASLTTPVSQSTYTGNTVGAYPIVPSGATSPNYAIAFVNGTLIVTPAAARTLLVDGLPTTASAGSPQTFSVSAIDRYGNVATSYLGTVTFSAGPGSADLPMNYTFTAADAGTHVFGATFYQAGLQTLIATDTAAPYITSTGALVISPAAADHLLFLQQPTDTAAGQIITPALLVAVVDQFGNVVTTDNSDSVTVAIGSNPSGGILSGTLTLTVANGIATFSDLSIDQIGDGYTLHATVGGSLPDIDSSPFTITA